MTGPPWVADVLAGAMIVTVAYCLTRLTVSLRRGRRAGRLLDGTHALMGVAMAGMLVPGLAVTSRAVIWVAGLRIAFAVAAVWYAWLTLHGRQVHHAQHALACAAMIYMLSARPGGTVRGMTGGAHPRTLALLLALGLVCYVVWTADQLAAVPRVGTAGSARVASRMQVRELVLAVSAAGHDQVARHGHSAPLSIRLAASCDIAMGVTMAYMLIVMR